MPLRFNSSGSSVPSNQDRYGFNSCLATLAAYQDAQRSWFEGTELPDKVRTWKVQLRHCSRRAWLSDSMCSWASASHTCNPYPS